MALPANSRLKEKTLVIVNPVAGGGQAQRAAPRVADYFHQHGLQADFVHSQSSEDARRRGAEAVAAGYTCIAVLGGDGAFHHVVNGVLLDATGAAKPLLGFLPAGNGNDIAAGLGIPEDPIDAARTLLTAPERRIDVLRARFADGQTHLFVGAGGMGLDAEAARLVHDRFRRLRACCATSPPD